MGDDGPWEVWCKLVVHEMEENEDAHVVIDKRLDELEKKVDQLTVVPKKESKPLFQFDSRIGILIGAVLDWVLVHWPKSP